MALENSEEDQKARTIGEKLRAFVGMEVKPKPKVKDPEDAVDKLKKRRGRP